MRSRIELLFVASLLLVVHLAVPHDAASQFTLAALWGSIPASSSASFNSTFVPQWISFIATTVPTLFQIQVQGDGIIFNLDGAGLTNMNGIRTIGLPTNGFLYQLSDGLINGKNVTVTITNAVAAQLDIYYDSFAPGSFYCTTLIQNALLNSGFVLEKFAYAAFPSAGATDLFQVQFTNGIVQTMNRLDLQNLLSYKQNSVQTRYNIDNVSPAIVKTVTIIPVASQNVYAMWYQPQRGSVDASVTQRGKSY